MRNEEEQELEDSFNKFLEVYEDFSFEVLEQSKCLLLPLTSISVLLKLGYKFTGLKLDGTQPVPWSFILPESNQVFLQEEIREFEWNFAACHELGHLIRGKKYLEHRTSFANPSEYLSHIQMENTTTQLGYNLTAPDFLFKFLAAIWPPELLSRYFLLRPFHIYFYLIYLSELPCTLRVYHRDKGLVFWVEKGWNRLHDLFNQLLVNNEDEVISKGENRSINLNEGKSSLCLQSINMNNELIYFPLEHGGQWLKQELIDNENKRKVLKRVEDMFKFNILTPSVYEEEHNRWGCWSIINISPTYARIFEKSSNIKLAYVWEIPWHKYEWLDYAKKGSSYPPWIKQIKHLYGRNAVNDWLNDLRKSIGLGQKRYKYKYYIDKIEDLNSASLDDYYKFISHFFEIASYKSEPRMPGSFIHTLVE